MHYIVCLKSNINGHEVYFAKIKDNSDVFTIIMTPEQVLMTALQWTAISAVVR